MKTLLLSFFLLLISTAGFSKTWTIANSGSKFSPTTTTITFGDTVNFVLESIHNAKEVSQATWTANDNTPLPGGFSIGFGGGMVLPSELAVGTHYFVCDPHASMGMKGTIVVKAAAGIDESQLQPPVSIFPNPATDFITVKAVNNRSGIAYTIVDELGKQILTGKLVNAETTIVINQLAAGMYFFQTGSNKKQAFTVIRD
jgi:plastocyanin